MKEFTSKAQKTGKKGEDTACMFLVKQGFTIFERNISNKFGEIDIVAKKRRTYYFFEVKAGKGGSWFNPAHNLTPAKIRKLLISVEHYCLTRNIREYYIKGLIVYLPQVEGGEAKTEMFDLT